MPALPSALVAVTKRAVACDAEQHFDASWGWRAGDWRRQAHIDGEASAANEAFLEAVADDSFENMPVGIALPIGKLHRANVFQASMSNTSSRRHTGQKASLGHETGKPRK